MQPGLMGRTVCAAVAEDKALEGCNLSAVDGPGLVGVESPAASFVSYSKCRDEIRMNSNLQNEIRSLSAAEKVELIDALWESLEADVPALTDEQRAELDHRVARYQNNPSDVIPWEQVKAGLFKKQ